MCLKDGREDGEANIREVSVLINILCQQKIFFVVHNNFYLILFDEGLPLHPILVKFYSKVSLILKCTTSFLI